MIQRILVSAVAILTVYLAHADNISFADAVVKALCIQHWDTDGDEELSMEEAAAVTTLGGVFRENIEIASFDELQFFTGLTSIDDYAFYKSTVQKVAFPATVTAIGEYAFSESCIGSELRVPGTVKEIKNYAFYSCRSLASVVLEEGVEVVGWHTFSGPITTMVLPKSLTFIKSMGVDPYVNANTSSGIFLPEGDLWVFARAEEPAPINDFAFYYVYGDGHLVVPSGCVDAYTGVLGWSQFREYIEMGDVNADGSVNHFDVVLLRDYLDGKDVELKNDLLADVNGDGVSDEQDYEELKDRVYIDDGTPTMIAEAETKEQSVPEGVYTIDGRKVLDDVSQLQSLRPGIYISGGRKFIVR
ncbi:MAG: leucine-rich repeat protein [Prevotella sp.]|nr:leucine-rich repeat protein [Prevotella sp.]